jgi:hypothetical protein
MNKQLTIEQMKTAQQKMQEDIRTAVNEFIQYSGAVPRISIDISAIRTAENVKPVGHTVDVKTKVVIKG